MLVFPFCPNSACVYHQQVPEGQWFYPFGSYTTKTFGKVQRFRCSRCGTSFSSQTFSIDYYAKKVINYSDLLDRLVASECSRSIARALHLSPDSIQNRIDRLARQSVALHANLRTLADSSESVCVDGFVSFDRSKYFPNELTMSITADSRFVLDVAHASRRRSGRMRREQKHHARILYAAVELEHDAIARSFREILDSLARERPPSLVHPLIITTDEKPDYARTFHAHPLFRFQTDTSRTVHRTVNSTLPRTFKNPLFASNYLDRELRKDLANNHRESACFSRNALSRLACYIFSHNYRKQYLIKSGGFDQRLHATVAGIPHSAIAAGLEEFCSKRQFLSRLSLPPTLDRIWRKTTPTPLKTKKEYLPAFALA